MLYLPFVASPLSVGSSQFGGASLSLVLSLAELIRAPSWLEQARRRPPERCGEAPLKLGRADAFLIAWRIQTLLFSGALLWPVAWPRRCSRSLQSEIPGAPYFALTRFSKH